jgi:GDPmannose 4,6-dehydratase
MVGFNHTSRQWSTLKTALITGITGQDGFHLTDLLLKKNYRIYGLLNGQRNSRVSEFTKMFPDVKLIEGDLTDFSSLIRAISDSKPDEIYNLGAISFVGLSFKQPELTADVTGLGPLRLLEAIRTIGAESDIKFYQASSSEMFGKVQEVPQTELTSFYPRSPYGVSKVFAHQICVNYREAYNMHISCGILFNHEGEYRGEEFVTRKITKGIAQISKGKLDKIRLGTLEPKRDWGYAGDYVEAMWLMLQQEVPTDFVVATGKTHSVRDFLELAIQFAGLKGQADDYVLIDEIFKRPAEVDLLVGDATKAKKNLGWEPKVSFEDLVKKMVVHDMNT